MNIPNFDAETFVDSNGRLTSQANLMMSQLFTLLQQNLSDEGYKLPKQDSSTILRLNTEISTSNIIYNNSTGKGMICENGVFKTITTS